MDQRNVRAQRSQGGPPSTQSNGYGERRRDDATSNDGYYNSRNAVRGPPPPRDPSRDAQRQPTQRDRYDEWRVEPPPRSRERDRMQQHSQQQTLSQMRTGPQPNGFRNDDGVRRGQRGGVRNDGYTAYASQQTGRRYESGSVDAMEDILFNIEQDWDFITEDDFVPIKLALELMDTSSLGRAHQYNDFKELHSKLQYSLQAVVNDHYQGFNSSIGTYHNIMRSIATSQEKVRELRDSLIQAKEDLSANKPEVKNLINASQEYSKMLKTLSSIQQLQLVPEKLEARISEKRFLTAVEVLSEAMRVIKQPELMEIGALQDLRIYLGNQETSLADILVEELHNHLYLKSPYCEDRWRPFAPGQKEMANGVEEAHATGHIRPFQKFVQTADLTKPMTEDPNKNPEAESLSYIRLLLESLNYLGHLPNAIANINQRLPVELFKLVDKTNNEVDQRHPSSFGSSSRRRGQKKGMDFGLSESDIRLTVLNDLLWTLYSKFEAVMEGHRVVHDVVKEIAKREESRDGSKDLSSTNGFLEVWQLIQSEMRSLLHDYLTANESRGVSNAPKGTQNLNNIISGKVMRDKSRSVFKLASANLTTPQMKMDSEDLENILKTSVPGLVSESLRPVATNADAQNSNTSDGAATGHKLLIEPSVFNMGFLLPPSLAFLQRVKEIVPPNSGIPLGSLTSFLDDFLVNVFHPSLDDTMRDLFNHTISDIDAFQEELNWATLSKKPIMKGTAAFFDLITAFCRMLETIPPDTVFAELIIDLLTNYYAKCAEHFKFLMSKTRDSSDGQSAGQKAASTWVQNPELKSTLRSIWKLENDASAALELFRKEAATEVELAKNMSITPKDLIQDRKTLASLSLLYTSMKWLAMKVSNLRHVEEMDNVSRKESTGTLKRRWTLARIQRANALPQVEKDDILLPMTKEVVPRFDEILGSFFSLASTVLYSLRADAHLHVIYNLQETLKLHSKHLNQKGSSSSAHTSFQKQEVSHGPRAADRSVLTLNAWLVTFSEEIERWLREKEVRFLTSGLGHLIEHIIVTKIPSELRLPGDMSEKIVVVEQLGFDVLVMQQNLKNIEVSESGASLERASTFLSGLLGGNAS